MEPEKTNDPTSLWAWNHKTNQFMQPSPFFMAPWKPMQLTPEQQADSLYQYNPEKHPLYRDIQEQQRYQANEWKRQAQTKEIEDELDKQIDVLQRIGRYSDADLLIAQYEKARASGEELTPTAVWGPIKTMLKSEDPYVRRLAEPIRYGALGQIIRERLSPDGTRIMSQEELIMGIPNPYVQLRGTENNPHGGKFKAKRIKKVNGKWIEYPHGGADFATEVGTPIISPHDGLVADKIVTEQPNRINDKYPADYKGNRNNAGNRISVDFDSERGLRDTYYHLQAGNPIGINRRTGLPFAVGDSVFMGDTIGYVGITGNPNPLRPHNHYEVEKTVTDPHTRERRVVGKLNPFDYINAIYDEKTNRVIYPKLKINRQK